MDGLLGRGDNQHPPHPARRPAVGLYSWGSEGVGFDDVTGVRLGTDPIAGTEGDDILRGGAGSDVVLAAGGDDLLRASDGDDLLRGEEGDDRLYGENGDDALSGDDGDDVHVVDDAGDAAVEVAGGGYDTVIVTGAAYALGAEVEVLLGTGADQGLTGNGGATSSMAAPGRTRCSAARERTPSCSAPARVSTRWATSRRGWTGSTRRASASPACDAALATASQAGANVLFDFGGGDQLLVRVAVVAALSDSILV